MLYRIQILERTDNFGFGIMQLDGRRVPSNSEPLNSLILQGSNVIGIIMCVDNFLHLPVSSLASQLHPG